MDIYISKEVIIRQNAKTVQTNMLASKERREACAWMVAECIRESQDVNARKGNQMNWIEASSFNKLFLGYLAYAEGKTRYRCLY